MMKKIIALLLFALSFVSIAQKSPSCCVKPGENTFALLTKRKDFKDAHMSPRPFHYESEKGEMIKYKTPDGSTANAFAVKSGATPKAVIFVFHEWWGLNDYIKREAEQLQKELGNVDVYALDLYDGKVTADASEAGKLMGGLDFKRASNIVKGAFDMIGKDVKVGTVGWCMGGSWSFQAAILGGKQVNACAMYYGFPEKDKEKIKAVNSDVLYIAANNDSFISQTDRDQFVKDLTVSGKKITVKGYDADHAFANPSNPKYNREFAENAKTIVLNYFKKNLGL